MGCAGDGDRPDMVSLRNVPDVFGMSGRQDSATESHILQGRDARSVRVLVPDCRCLEQNFHDVTVVDMGDLPESKVSIPELSELARRWPPAVITHMWWRQPELEELKQAARVQYWKKQPAACEFCSTMIRCDMYRHVEVPGFVVHHLEGCATGFDGPCSGIPQRSPTHQVRNAHTSLDGDTAGVHGLTDVASLRDIE